MALISIHFVTGTELFANSNSLAFRAQITSFCPQILQGWLIQDGPNGALGMSSSAPLSSGPFPLLKNSLSTSNCHLIASHLSFLKSLHLTYAFHPKSPCLHVSPFSWCTGKKLMIS